MQELREIPAWVQTLYRRRARGTAPPSYEAWSSREHASPELARGSAPALDPMLDFDSAFAPSMLDDATLVTAMPDHIPRKRRRIGRWLFLISFVAVAATVTVAGVRMWRDARPKLEPGPTAALAAANGRIELSPDRRAIARLTQGAVKWRATSAAAVDSIETTPTLVLARTSGTLAALDLETGNTRFAWAVPAGERWAAQRPAEIGACLIAITTRSDDAVVRCIELASGNVKWTAKLAAGHDCVHPPIGVTGAVLVQCPGWTTVIDDQTGAVAVDADGVGLIQRDPPTLLRGGSHPTLAPWQASSHRFRSGTPLRAQLDGATSAVLHHGRMVVRASSASDKLVTIVPKTGAPIAIAVPEHQLADDTPLAVDCDGGESPRFQLFELAPRAGTTFDPAAAQHRVLALVDVEAGRLAWTSHKMVPPRHLGAPTAPICRHGHYFVPLELHGATGVTPALWIVDAASGATTAALAFDPESEASFAELTADQIDNDRIVGVGRHGAFEVHWRGPLDVPGLRDAREGVEQALGRLP
jgi:hypothetical protein